MKSAKTGAASGCVVWIIVFSILCSCLAPVAMVVGSISSAVMADSVANTLAPYLCPENTKPDIFTYETTTEDENGFETPATAFEMRCVDASGKIVKDIGPNYAFIWMGLLSAVGVILAAILAFLLAAPAGALIAKATRKKQSESQNSA